MKKSPTFGRPTSEARSYGAAMTLSYRRVTELRRLSDVRHDGRPTWNRTSDISEKDGDLRIQKTSKTEDGFPTYDGRPT